jgi:hypothetical protein
MRAMLDPTHANRRQLADLVASKPPLRTPLLGTEPAAAPTTRLRIVIDDLIELILRPQLTARTLMPRLPTRLTLLTLSAQ